MSTDLLNMKHTVIAASVVAIGVALPSSSISSLAAGAQHGGSQVTRIAPPAPSDHQHLSGGHALALTNLKVSKPNTSTTLPIITSLPRSFSVSNDPANAGGADSTTRWNPCSPIHWQINLNGAPRFALRDAKGAISQLSRASGLSFVYDGTTSVTPDGDFGSAGDATQSFPPLTIAFPKPGTTQNLPTYAAGVGGWHAVMVSPDQGLTWVPRIVAGFVLVDRKQASHMKTGFGTGGTTGELLMHELGHVVGLGHVGDPSQVMYPTITAKRAAYGKGDLTGLRQVGAQAGCLPQLPPVDGYVTTGP